MTNPSVREGLAILAGGQNIEALRRLIVMTIVGRYLAPSSTHGEQTNGDSLSALLSRLPIKTLAVVASISKGKTGIKDARPGPFPLVVTAETRSSADHFDFEGPSVMIPMVSSTGHGDASLKRIHFQDGQYAVGSILAVVQPKDSSVLSARFLHAYLSAFKDELLVSRMVGTANVSLTVAKIGDVPVPLLPIEGQHKIDELMALCDRLEAEQTDAEGAHARLVETLLGTLTQSADAAELAANWQRLAEHFGTLFTTESSLDALKQTILQLAVMGKLVPQDPTDEPASELLKRIAQERARLEEGTTRKKSKAMPPVGEDEKPFEVPNGWLWVPIGAILGVTSSKRIFESDYVTRGVPFYRSKEIGELSRWGTTTANFHISDEKYADLVNSRDFPRAGDLLLTSVGSIGNTWIVDDRRFYFKDGNITQIIQCDVVNMNYVQRFIQGPIFLRMATDTVSGTAYNALTIIKIKQMPFPLPPLAEQHRIVAKVDELMALCDRLKADLAESRTRQARLSATLIESALQAA